MGRERALWFFLAMLCGAIAVYASVPVLPLTLLGALLCGAAGSGVTITVAAALVARHGDAGPAAVTKANALAAAAGLVGPLAVGGAVGLGYGFRPAIFVVVVLIGALFAIRRLFRAPLPTVGTSMPADIPRPRPAPHVDGVDRTIPNNQPDVEANAAVR